MNIKRVDLSLENIEALECLRYDAYKMNSLEIPYLETFYANEMKKGKYVVYACYINLELVAACYVSNAHKLYIEQIFVKEKYQSMGIDKTLLQYVLSNKKEIEEYFNEEYDYSYLSPKSNSYNKYYENLGFREVDSMYMKKRL